MLLIVSGQHGSESAVSRSLFQLHQSAVSLRQPGRRDSRRHFDAAEPG